MATRLVGRGISVGASLDAIMGVLLTDDETRAHHYFEVGQANVTLSVRLVLAPFLVVLDCCSTQRAHPDDVHDPPPLRRIR